MVYIYISRNVNIFSFISSTIYVGGVNNERRSLENKLITYACERTTFDGARLLARATLLHASARVSEFTHLDDSPPRRKLHSAVSLLIVHAWPSTPISRLVKSIDNTNVVKFIRPLEKFPRLGRILFFPLPQQFLCLTGSMPISGPSDLFPWTCGSLLKLVPARLERAYGVPIRRHIHI